MRNLKLFLSIFVLLFVLTGCVGNSNNLPLVFGETITFGVSISGSAPEQGGEFAIGFRSRDIAVVPAVARDYDGKLKIIDSKVGSTNPQDRDALSVIGQFQAQSGVILDSNNNVQLGKYFATGLAAQKLADGFACALAGKDSNFCKSPEDSDEDDSDETVAEETGTAEAAESLR